MSDHELAAILMRAEAMLELERLQEAQALYRRALGIVPEEASIVGELASITAQLGETAEADRLARQMLQLAPEDPNSHAVMAEVALHRNDIDQAEVSSDAWVMLQPDNYGAQALRCRIQLIRGHRLKALRMAEHVRDTFAHEVEAHVLHAQMAEGLMRIKLARGSAERALALDPQHPEAILLTGRAWAYKTRTELDAVELLANGCALYPENEALREELDSAIRFYVGSATISAIVAVLLPPYLLIFLWDVCLGRRLRIRKLSPSVQRVVLKRLRIKQALVLRKIGIVFGFVTLCVFANRVLQGGYEFGVVSLALCVSAALALGAGLHGFQRARFHPPSAML